MAAVNAGSSTRVKAEPVTALNTGKSTAVNVETATAVNAEPMHEYLPKLRDSKDSWTEDG